MIILKLLIKILELDNGDEEIIARFMQKWLSNFMCVYIIYYPLTDSESKKTRPWKS